MSKFDSSQKIGDIVVRFPKAADIFKEKKIDFCCGGDKPLIDAINEKGLNETEIINSLNTLYEEYAINADAKDWTQAPIEELEKEHIAAGDILKELEKVTSDYLIPDDVCGTFEMTYAKLKEMESDLFQHIHLENNILFPRLRALL